MATKQQTATTLATQLSNETAAAQKREQELLEVLKAEEQVAVSLAPQYAVYFGKVMTVCLSGLTVYIPVDGRSHKVAKSFAAEIHRRRKAVDDYNLKRQRAANVRENSESYIGELQIH